MNKYLSIPILAACALALTGCGLDALENKPSAAREHIERMELLKMPAKASPEPVIEAVVPVVVKPACQNILRVYSCDEEGNGTWL